MLLKLAALAAALAIGCNGAASEDASATSPLADAFASDDGANEGAPEASDDDGSSESSADEVAAGDGDTLVVLPAQFVDEGVPMRMLADGDPVDLWSAPQGGHVVLFGAKVRNMTSDTANLKVRFRRPDTGLIVAEEGRTVKMVPVPDEPGLLQPDIRSNSQVANVPLCPSYTALGIVDDSFDVEVEVTALYTQPVQTGQAAIQVVARCSTPSDEAFCRCDCGPDYFLGKCSGFDEAGPPRGGPDATPIFEGGGDP